MTRWISLVCLLVAFTPGYAQDLLSRVKADYLAKDKQYDRLPTFGTGARSLAGYLSEKLSYPETAAAEGAEGQVLIGFTVDKTGLVKDVEVIRGVREDFNRAVVQTFTAMPRWKPATRHDAPLEAELLFLVTFNLRGDTYTTEYRTDWLVAMGISGGGANQDLRFLLEENRKPAPAKRPLLIQNRQPAARATPAGTFL
jgi:TonB family protein